MPLTGELGRAGMRRSPAPGEHNYEHALRQAELKWVASSEDESGNHHYVVEKS